MELVKKIWSCPRHEIKFLVESLEGVAKLLVIFSGLFDNRTYMLLTNRLIPLCDLICWILSKPHKMISNVNYLPSLFYILTLHLKHKLPDE